MFAGYHDGRSRSCMMRVWIAWTSVIILRTGVLDAGQSLASRDDFIENQVWIHEAMSMNADIHF